jgi:hypothetical protein
MTIEGLLLCYGLALYKIYIQQILSKKVEWAQQTAWPFAAMARSG